MIDLVYKTLLTIINKENQGYVSPDEFNKLSNLVQIEIFNDYFSEENKDKLKENKGFTNKGYGNLDFNRRQLISNFYNISVINSTNGLFSLPVNLSYIEDDGVINKSNGKVIEEVERNIIGYLNQSELSKASQTYPIYERYGDHINVFPTDIAEIELKYIRQPSHPRWTHIMINDNEFFDPTNSSYQDFELHKSEFSNIVLKLLTYFGINLRESDIVNISESLKDKQYIKENN